jgi:hypothetical protein
MQGAYISTLNASVLFQTISEPNIHLLKARPQHKQVLCNAWLGR